MSLVKCTTRTVTRTPLSHEPPDRGAVGFVPKTTAETGAKEMHPTLIAEVDVNVNNVSQPDSALRLTDSSLHDLVVKQVDGAGRGSCPTGTAAGCCST